MNKTFKNVFAKAKLENRSCFVGFVTGMDPDFNSSKKILKELSKYCDVIEVGIPFNTSTSDSSIIMSANDLSLIHISEPTRPERRGDGGVGW